MRQSANACQDCGSARHGAIRNLYFMEVSPTGSMRVYCVRGDSAMEKNQHLNKFIRMCVDGWSLGWHEYHGGNLTYRIEREELAGLELNGEREWVSLKKPMENLAGDCFLVTGSGKTMRNAELEPKDALGIIELDEKGQAYRIVWGLEHGGKPTSELPAHLMCQSVKKEVTGGTYRFVYHAHPANIIALSFVLPLQDEAFTRELWEMEPEYAMTFPAGIGVLPWMVPGTVEIAKLTCEKMKTYDAVLWAQHGLFVTGDTFEDTFGLMHTIEKSAEILVKVRSMAAEKLQVPSVQNFRDMAEAFQLKLPEKFLFEK